MLFQLLAVNVLALSPEQKNLYRKNIFYYEKVTCDTADAGAAAAAGAAGGGGTVSGDVKSLAKQVLENDKIDKDNGRVVREDLEEAAAGKPSNGSSELSKYVLALLLEIAKDHKVSISSITGNGSGHSSGSDHYTGMGIDIQSLDGVPTNGTDAKAQTIVTIAGRVLPKGSSFGLGGNPGAIRLPDGMTGFADAPNHVHISVGAGGDKNQTTSLAPGQGSGVVAGASTDDNTDSSKTLYMVGDSIAVGAKDELEDQFKEQGITSSYINGSVGRSITGKGTSTGQKTSGLEAVEDDKNRIKNASIVVIGLGTNPESNFEESAKKLLDKVKGLSPDAKIYWVNVFSTGGNVKKEETNKSIQKLSTSEGFTVIDLSSADIKLGSDDIHPTPEGQKTYAAAVAGEVGGGGTAPAADPAAGSATQCQCGGGTSASSAGSSQLVGSENAEKIFNFFVGQGLKPFQAAGIMGNMAEESGLNPKALQPGTTGDFPIAGRGYGLVQWTFPVRQDPLIKKARDAGKKVYDLGIQLEYVIDELNSTHKDAFAALKASTNYKEATLAIELKYEIHAGGIQLKRQDTARDYLAKYGSGTPASPTGTPTSAPASCGSAAGGGAGGGSVGGPAQEFSGSGKEAAAALLANPDIKIFDDKDMIQQAANGQQTPLNEELIKFLAAMAQTHKFGISSLYRGPCSDSNHCSGNAADINPTIDGETISYNENNAKIQKFIDDAAKLLASSCENGVPNQGYVDKTKANGSKCEVFVDRGSGPHVHLSVSQ